MTGIIPDGTIDIKEGLGTSLLTAPQKLSINIEHLARELGVDSKYFTYGQEEVQIASELFVRFASEIGDVAEGDSVVIAPELDTHISGTMNSLQHDSYLPFFIRITNDANERWKKPIFFKLWLLNYHIRHLEKQAIFLGSCLRTLDKDFSQEDAERVIMEKCSLEFIGILGHLFQEELKPLTADNLYYKKLVEKLQSLREWYHDWFLTEAVKKYGPDFIGNLQRIFWSENELPMLAFLAQNKITESIGDKHFIQYFDRFLCHENSPYFFTFLCGILDESNNFMSRIRVWAYARKDLLIAEEENELQRIFRKYFVIRSRLFTKGRLTEEARDKLSPALIRIFDSFRPTKEKASRRIRSLVQENIPNSAHESNVVARLSQVVAPVSENSAPKKFIEIPRPGSLFVRSGEKKQLAQLNLSGVNFPDGTIVKFERQLPRSKTFESLQATFGQVNEIPAIMGQDYKGQFVYRLTIILPGEYRFPDGKTKTILEHKIYAEADPTPDEINARESQRQSHHTVRTTPVPVIPVVQERVSALVETMPTLPKQKTVADTVTAWELAIQEGSITPELRDDGVVIFHLPDEFVDELHDASFEVLQITPEGTINPDIGKCDIASQLENMAQELREKKQLEHALVLQVEQEEKEYQMLREQFQPFYDFIGEQTFVDKNNKALFDKASEGFKISLKSLGWSMPWRITKDGQIQFRHIRNDIKITYSNLGVVIHVVGEKRTLSRAEERCYREIAEAFSHLALFYTADYRERQKMITKEKKFQKDMRQGAEAYEELLREGKARLVQYYSGDKGSIFVTKFPLDDRPHMLPEKVGCDTVEEALQKNEHSELCYRRDILRINGEIDEDAEEQSVENALQNLNDLRQSPRARYILRKRILITLDYEKFSGDDTRRAIQPEKNGRKKTSAYEILQSLKIEKNIESKEQIDDEFMDAYIDLLIKHRIRVQYVWPLSVSLKTHREQL